MYKGQVIIGTTRYHLPSNTSPKLWRLWLAASASALLTPYWSPFPQWAFIVVFMWLEALIKGPVPAISKTIIPTYYKTIQISKGPKHYKAALD